MANIDHVNRRFFLRFLCSPVISFFWCFRYIFCKRESRKYLSGASELSMEDRYEKFFSFFGVDQFLNPTRSTFIFDEKLLQAQTVFVIDESITWESLVLLKYVWESHGIKFPSVVLQSDLPKQKFDSFWDLVDRYYGEKDLSRAIESKRSFLIEKKMLCDSLSCSAEVKESYLTVVPVHVFKAKHKNFYRFGDSIKTSKLISMDNISFAKILEKAFLELKNKFLDDIRKSPDNKKNK